MRSALLLAVVGFSVFAQNDIWSTVAVSAEPTARHEAAMVAVGGKAYLMGGRGVKPVEEFDPSTRAWRKLGPTPIEMHHFQPVVLGELVYVMTAMTGRYPKETPLETIYIYDPKSDSWRQGPAVPAHRRRGGAGTVVHDGKIYLAGGIVDGHTSGTVAWLDEFDPATGAWRELPDAPRIRDHFPAIVASGKLYCVGGRNTSYHTPDSFTAFFATVIPEVDVYDFAAARWTTLASRLPVPTAAGGLVEWRGSLLYMGGESEQRVAHAEVQRMDLQTGEWQLVAPLVRGRHGGGAVVLDGRIWVAVGSGGRGGGPELASTEAFPALPALTLADIRVRDPFILADGATRTYYLYAQIANRVANPARQGVEVYTSGDLEQWRGPETVFEVPADSWAGQQVWAPEVHAYQGKYYLFVTLTGKSNWSQAPGRPAMQPRGTQILVADSPRGPFRPFANGPHTPADWMSLDGTLWVESGVPWMIFCHEWIQIENGTMELARLKPDLSAVEGAPRTLFRATDAPWVRSLKDAGGRYHGYITDGPFLHRTYGGKLLMIWSSFGDERYAIGLAESESGTIEGPWRQRAEPLFQADGGHGMIFRTFEAKLMLVFHQPNRGNRERARLYELADTGGVLRVR